MKINRALIAVYDKTGIADFARTLVEEFDVEILSTGGTARHLAEAGVPVTLVEEVTGFPEMLDGRVKTLHPKIHAAILADRDNPEHMGQLAEQDIEPIDMVVVNLYPFEQTIAQPDCRFEDAIEMIDIGGPCLLRAAAKNHKHVLAVCSSSDFAQAIRLLGAETDESEEENRRMLAVKAFRCTRSYDLRISNYMISPARGAPAGNALCLAPTLSQMLEERTPTRYGENPHQYGAYYCMEGEPDESMQFAGAHVKKVSSFNNFLDANAALELCAELTRGLSQPNEPRTSVRADKQERQVPDLPSLFTPPDPSAKTWLLTWTMYGSWLPGDKRGFVSRVPTDEGTHRVHNVPGTPHDTDQKDVEASARGRMEGKPVTLTAEQGSAACHAFIEAATNHGIVLVAASVMPDHVHLLCQDERTGGELLRLFKGVSSRRLGQRFKLHEAPRWWTKSGSTRHFRPGSDLRPVIAYVMNQAGALCAGSFEGMGETDFGACETARTEVRGSLSSAIGVFTCVFVKHTNPCGCGVTDNPLEAYRRAYLGDPNAAMGGVLACNFPVTADFAAAVMETYDRWGRDAGAGGFFVEVWIAPTFEEAAPEVIRTTKKWGQRVRLLRVGDMCAAPDARQLNYRSITGGMLIQTRDVVGLNEDQWEVVTERQPTEQEMADLRLAWLICKHTKSNAITMCRDGMLIGNGAGQMSRVMSCRIATWLARENGHLQRDGAPNPSRDRKGADREARGKRQEARGMGQEARGMGQEVGRAGPAASEPSRDRKGAEQANPNADGPVAASDAFFPFRDGPDLLMDAGVTAIIQPGGSKRDADTVAACNERGAAMVFTHTRHFKH